eukprot:13312003-Alexandrium_andersonii.AAC.1
MATRSCRGQRCSASGRPKGRTFAATRRGAPGMRDPSAARFEPPQPPRAAVLRASVLWRLPRALGAAQA